MRTVLWVAIVVSSAIRIWAISGSFFWQDDYVHMWSAWNQPASTFLLQEWNGHFEPASWVFYWVSTRAFPQQWWPAVVLLSALAVGLTLAWWWLVRTLAGSNWYTVAVTVVFAFWPGLLVPQVWLATGLEMMALLFAILTVAAAVHERGRVRALAFVFLPLGCMFNERALYAVPLLLLTLIIFAKGDGLRARVAQRWSSHKKVIVGLILEAVAVVWVLSALIGDTANDGRLTAKGYLEGLWLGGPQGVLKSLLGLELFWPDQRVTTPPGPAMWAQVATLAVTLTLIVLAWRSDRRQLLICAASVFVMFALEVLLVAALRTDFMGIALIRDPRYTFATGILILLSVLSFPDRHPPTGKGRRGTKLWIAFAAIIATTGSVSMLRIANIVDGESSRVWLETAREAFVQSGAPLVSTPSPPAMLAGFFIGETPQGYPQDLGTTRTLLAVGPEQPDFASTAVLPVAAGLTGAPTAVDIFPVTSSTAPGFGGNCSVTLSTEDWTDVPMAPATLSNPAVVIDYLAASETNVLVDVDGWRTSVRVPPGFQSMWFFPPAGPFDGLRLKLAEPSGRFCVGAAKAGSPQAVSGP